MKSERSDRRLLRLPKDDSYVLLLEDQRIWVNPKKSSSAGVPARDTQTVQAIRRTCYDEVDICPSAGSRLRGSRWSRRAEEEQYHTKAGDGRF